MYVQFLLPKRNSNTTLNNTLIAVNMQSAVFQDVFPAPTLEIKNTGNTPFKVYIAPNENTFVPANALFIAPNDMQIVVAQAITTDAGTVLVIGNQSNIAGSYIVTEQEE